MNGPTSMVIVPAEIHPLDSPDHEAVINLLRQPPSAVKFNDEYDYYADWWCQLLKAAGAIPVLPQGNISPFKYYADQKMFMIDGREWQLTPKIITGKMATAGFMAWNKSIDDCRADSPTVTYEAMLAEAQKDLDATVKKGMI